MFQISKLCFLHVQTPLHAGSGQDLGPVDLPIQRERHTHWPKIEASSIKGSLREILQQQLKQKEPKDYHELIELTFGPEDGDKHASALGFCDARILLFPVKSMKGVFAYTTCPSVLERLKQELQLLQPPLTSNLPKIPPSNLPKIALSSNACEYEKKIFLEEYTFNAEISNFAKKWGKWLANATKIPHIENRLAILPDDDFTHFVKLSTEVITRTKIDSHTGTVQEGALFTEEFLPCETLLYTLVLASPVFQANSQPKNLHTFLFKNGTPPNGKIQPNQNKAEHVMLFFEKLLPPIIQIGGDATLGKGLVQTHILNTDGGE